MYWDQISFLRKFRYSSTISGEYNARHDMNASPKLIIHSKSNINAECRWFPALNRLASRILRQGICGCIPEAAETMLDLWCGRQGTVVATAS
jgi:hypothetical protein